MSLTFEQIQIILQLHITSFCEFAFLMGSAATPYFHSESDIDIAIFLKKEFLNDNQVKYKIINNLEDQFQHPIDLIILNKIDPIFSHQVLAKGRLILNLNSDLLLNWKTLEMSKYPDFKFSRQIIEQNILKRKKHV